MNEMDDPGASGGASAAAVDTVAAVAAIACSVERSGGRVVAVHIDGVQRRSPDRQRSVEGDTRAGDAATQAGIVDPRT